jgi:hypothetical protein
VLMASDTSGRKIRSKWDEYDVEEELKRLDDVDGGSPSVRSCPLMKCNTALYPWGTGTVWLLARIATDIIRPRT